MKVNWTPSAQKSFEQILDWLYEKWTNKKRIGKRIYQSIL